MSPDLARRGRRLLVDPTLLRFGAVGVLNVGVDVLGFMLLAAGLGLAPGLANGLAFSTAILTSYSLNSAWTFNRRYGPVEHVRRFGLFLLVNVIGLTLSTVTVLACLQLMSELPAKLASIPPVFFWNYVGARLIVFRPAAPAWSTPAADGKPLPGDP